MRIVGMAVVGFLLCSCSVVFVERVPAEWTPRMEPRCTAAPGFPLWDMAMATVSVGSGVFVYANARDRADDGTVDQQSVDRAIGLSIGLVIVGAAHAISSAVGFARGRECERARAERDRWIETGARPRTSLSRPERHAP